MSVFVEVKRLSIPELSTVLYHDGTETGKLLKSLHTNNEGEYISHEFREYCSKHEIRHEKMVTRTP